MRQTRLYTPSGRLLYALSCTHAFAVAVARAEDKSTSAGAGGSSKESSKKGKDEKEGGSWLYNNVNLVISACFAGIVAILLSLIVVWWMLKKRAQKIDKEASGCEVSGEGKMAPTVDTVGLRSGAGPDNSMYPHFNANPPPPAVHVSFNEPVSPSASYGRDDGSFEDSAVGGKYGGGEGGQSHALGPIREHPDEEEHMHEDAEEEGHDRRGQGTRLGARVPAGNHPPPPETFDPHQQHLYQSPDSYGERFADRAAPAASQLQPSHTRIPSDPRDSYYNDHHRPRAGLGAPGNLGARHLSTIDERGSVYSQQTAGYV